MRDDRQVIELFCVLVEWALGQGLERAGLLPGNWEGETDQWRVTCNGSQTDERDEVPPLTFRLVHKTALVGVAFVSPFDGSIAGPTEEEVIRHFRERTT